MPGHARGVLVDHLRAGRRRTAAATGRRDPCAAGACCRAAAAARRRSSAVVVGRRGAAAAPAASAAPAPAPAPGSCSTIREALAVGAPRELALAGLVLLAAAAAAGRRRSGGSGGGCVSSCDAEVDRAVGQLREHLAVVVPDLLDRPEVADRHVVGERLDHARHARRTCRRARGRSTGSSPAGRSLRRCPSHVDRARAGRSRATRAAPSRTASTSGSGTCAGGSCRCRRA